MGKTVVKITLLLLALVAIGVAASATNSQRQVGGFVAQLPPQEAAPKQPLQTQHRHIPSLPGTSITSRLEPDDRVVEVINDAIPFIGFHPTDAEKELESRLKFAPAVAVIEVTQKESAFSAAIVGGPVNDDSITSTLTVHIHEVLKDTTGQLVAGNLIAVREGGGEVVLPDGRRIIARHAVVRPSRVGGTYLAVLGFHQGQFLFDGLLSVEFDNGRIKRMRLDAPPDTDLEQKTPEWATQRARVLAERRKQ